MPYTTSYALNLRGDDGSVSRCIRLERFSLPLEGYQLSRQTVSNYTRQCGSVRVPVIGALVSILCSRGFNSIQFADFSSCSGKIRCTLDAYLDALKIKIFITILLKYLFKFQIFLNGDFSLIHYFNILKMLFSLIKRDHFLFIVSFMTFYFDRVIKNQTG